MNLILPKHTKELQTGIFSSEPWRLISHEPNEISTPFFGYCIITISFNSFSYLVTIGRFIDEFHLSVWYG